MWEEQSFPRSEQTSGLRAGWVLMSGLPLDSLGGRISAEAAGIDGICQVTAETRVHLPDRLNRGLYLSCHVHPSTLPVGGRSPQTAISARSRTDLLPQRVPLCAGALDSSGVTGLFGLVHRAFQFRDAAPVVLQGARVYLFAGIAELKGIAQSSRLLVGASPRGVSRKHFHS